MSDDALDYHDRAQLHRPRKAWQVGSAVRRLAQQGLTPRAIGAALGVDPTAVRSALTHAQNAFDASYAQELGQ